MASNATSLVLPSLCVGGAVARETRRDLFGLNRAVFSRSATNLNVRRRRRHTPLSPAPDKDHSQSFPRLCLALRKQPADTSLLGAQGAFPLLALSTPTTRVGLDRGLRLGIVRILQFTQSSLRPKGSAACVRSGPHAFRAARVVGRLQVIHGSVLIYPSVGPLKTRSLPAKSWLAKT